jgi:hypothetical protein
VNSPTDAAPAKRFFDRLYPEGIPNGMSLLIWTKQDKLSAWFSNTGDAADYAISRAPECDVYVGVSLRTAGLGPHQAGKLETIRLIPGFWGDFDCGDKDNGKSYPPSVADAHSLLADAPVAPSMVIGSGSGLHAYWLLKEPLLVETEESRSAAKDLVKAWSDHWGELARRRGWVLDSFGGINKQLRVPGTWNHNAD